MSDSVLDELVFQAAPLGEPLPAWPPSLSLHIASHASSGSASSALTSSVLAPSVLAAAAQGYTQAAPFFARHASIASSDVNWPAYCGLLRDNGMALQCSYSDVESLSDVNVPLRMLRRGYDEGFELNDLLSADAVLLDCVVSQAGCRCSRLPLETAGWHELKQLIDSLRQVVGPGTPIGLGLLAGDIYTDVSNALAARVDFVVLEFVEFSSQTDAALNHLAWGVVAARQACVQSGAAAFPIFVDAPLTNMDHIIKLFALGATSLNIDALTASIMPATAPSSVQVPKGLLSGIGSLPVKTTPNVQPLATKLDELLERLRARLFQQQLSSLSQLNRDHLRALNDMAAHLCAVKMLEHI